MIRKIDSFEDLDKLIPFIIKFHEKTGLGKWKSLSAIIGYLAFNLPNQNVGIWIDESDGIKGYAVVEISVDGSELEACITHAYMDEADEETTSEAFNIISEWAKKSGCNKLSCYTLRWEAMKRKYGFEPLRMYCVRRLQ